MWATKKFNILLSSAMLLNASLSMSILHAPLAQLAPQACSTVLLLTPNKTINNALICVNCSFFKSVCAYMREYKSEYFEQQSKYNKYLEIKQNFEQIAQRLSTFDDNIPKFYE